MICHNKKFIFVHICKTGGTSIEAALHEYFIKDPKIIREEGRDKSYYYTKHQFLADKDKYKFISSRMRRTPTILDCCIHPPDDYFKFTFVRNPWDKLVSEYFWRRVSSWSYRNNPRNNDNAQHWCNIKDIQFKDWILGEIPNSFRDTGAVFRQVDWINDKYHNIKTDYIGRFENLQEDFNHICDKIDIPRRILPHKYNSDSKVRTKGRSKPYQEYYDDESREFVADYFKEDIDYFGYKF